MKAIQERISTFSLPLLLQLTNSPDVQRTKKETAAKPHEQFIGSALFYCKHQIRTCSEILCFLLQPQDQSFQPPIQNSKSRQRIIRMDFSTLALDKQVKLPYWLDVIRLRRYQKRPLNLWRYPFAAGRIPVPFLRQYFISVSWPLNPLKISAVNCWRPS